MSPEIEKRSKFSNKFKPNFREISFVILLAACITVITGFIPNRAIVHYSDVMGCENGCEVPATGYPVAYITDKPYLSPVNSADWIGAILGTDRLHAILMLADFFIWMICLAAVVIAWWHLLEQLSKGSGHIWLAVIIRIFNSILVIMLINLAFVALGVVSGMLLMPYYWLVLILSVVFLMCRIYIVVQDRSDSDQC